MSFDLFKIPGLSMESVKFSFFSIFINQDFDQYHHYFHTHCYQHSNHMHLFKEIALDLQGLNCLNHYLLYLIIYQVQSFFFAVSSCLCIFGNEYYLLSLSFLGSEFLTAGNIDCFFLFLQIFLIILSKTLIIHFSNFPKILKSYSC